MNKIDVLDHGYVRLVSYMQPVPDPDPPTGGLDGLRKQLAWTGDLEIVRNARVSYNADWRDEQRIGADGIDIGQKDARLIKYLYEHDHTTPFEAMVFTFEVQAPIFVFRQWHRHRTWSYNEVSARYTELPDLFYIPDSDMIGKQSATNKQARDLGVADANSAEMAEQFVVGLQEHCAASYARYKAALEDGIPRELARCVLPVNTYSRMFATVNLHNLFRFLTLRLEGHAQYEIRVYAEALLTLVRPIVPVAVAAFEKELGL